MVGKRTEVDTRKRTYIAHECRIEKYSESRNLKWSQAKHSACTYYTSHTSQHKPIQTRTCSSLYFKATVASRFLLTNTSYFNACFTFVVQCSHNTASYRYNTLQAVTHSLYGSSIRQHLLQSAVWPVCLHSPPTDCPLHDVVHQKQAGNSQASITMLWGPNYYRQKNLKNRTRSPQGLV